MNGDFVAQRRLCARCEKPVYFAEEIVAIDKKWHKSCFTCANPECHRRLDSRNCTEHDEEAYCTHCYLKLFGPKGYGYGGTLHMENGSSSPTPAVLPFTQAQVAPILNGDTRRPSNETSKSVATSRVLGAQEKCGRCGKTVYMAERVSATGKSWHKMTCFTCGSCSKKLEPTSLCDREGEIYCKTCYGRQFGPKGYGYGLTLQMQQ